MIGLGMGVDEKMGLKLDINAYQRERKNGYDDIVACVPEEKMRKWRRLRKEITILWITLYRCVCEKKCGGGEWREAI